MLQKPYRTKHFEAVHPGVLLSDTTQAAREETPASTFVYPCSMKFLRYAKVDNIEQKIILDQISLERKLQHLVPESATCSKVVLKVGTCGKLTRPASATTRLKSGSRTQRTIPPPRPERLFDHKPKQHTGDMQRR